MNNSTYEDLQVIFEYYKDLKKHPFKNATFDAKLNNKGFEDSKLFRFVVDYFGFNKFPVVIPTRAFNKNYIKEFYHGFKEYEYGANFLVDWNYHYGNGYNDGFYVTDDEEVAKSYTGGFPTSQSNGLIMRVKPISNKFSRISEINAYIRGNSNCDDENVKNQLLKINEFYDYALRNGEDKSLLNDFYKCFIYNPSTFAVYLGFDYCIDDTFHNHLIIYNRGAICVPEADAKRFLSKSENYKDAVLNFYSNVDEIER